MGAFSHFRWFDLGDLTALTCAGAGGDLIAVPTEETPAATERGKT